MLCPDVNDTSNLVLDAYNTMLKIKNYNTVCNSLFIGKPGDIDPTWLTSVRSRVAMLKNSMSVFMGKQPEIFSTVLYPFINYQTLFAAFTEDSKQIQGKDQWIAALTYLKEALNTAVSTTNSASLEFQQQYQKLGDIQPLLDDSIEQGWNELASEEQAMVQIATAIGGLQQSVQDLSSSLTSSDIRNGKSYVQSTVTIAYSVAMAAGEISVPFLSFAGIVFTVGYSAYDVISNSAKIQSYMNQLTNLENEASAEAQAAAATKATIQVLSNLIRSFVAIGATLPRLTQMWKAQQDKVTDAINALQGGSSPNLLFDIQTMNIANATWTNLLNLVNTIQQPITIGKPVVLDTKKST